jgi:hypothetical protein
MPALKIGFCQLIACSRFLLAQLHLSSLTDKTTPKAIRAALQRMQRGSEALKDAYKNTVERIEGQQPGFRDLARKVLSWITYSQRPLTVLELQHALAVEVGDVELDAENIEEESQMISVCAGLVLADDKTKFISFVHYTAQEYFETVDREWLSNAQHNISMSCMTYLSFDTFASGWCSTDGLFKLRLKENGFLDYAARYWGFHASHVETQIVEPIHSSFLTKEGNITCATQVMLASDYCSPGYSQWAPQEVKAVHLLAKFGLVECMIAFLDHQHHTNLKDSYDQTPLLWAVKGGHEKMVKLLLTQDDIEVNSKDKYNRAPLLWAAEGGHEKMVKLLLTQDDIEVNSKDKYNQAPLFWAAKNGHENIVKLLLARDDIDVNSKESLSGTPLSSAAEKGHENIVKLLLAQDDTDVNSKDGYGRHHSYRPLKRVVKIW